MEQFDQNIIKESNNFGDELSLSEIINFFKRNYKFLSIFTFLSIVISAIYSLSIKPTWEGEFQIVLKTQSNNQASLSGRVRGLGIIPNISTGKSDTQTEVEILKSPLVMKPVFELFKEYNSEKIKDNQKFNYKKWMKNNLQIELLNDTYVLTVKYQDQKKSSIIPILNLISREYQNYSGKDRNIGIKNSIDYVKLQIQEKKEQTKQSIYALQEFSLKNNIGEFDGMIPNNFSSSNSSLNPNKSFSSSKRYTGQFEKLEELETDLVEKSALYRKDSDIIQLLDKQIKNLKESLKRPKEILLKYRELSRQANLDESALVNLEAQLTYLNIEKIKKSQPWRLISSPRLNDTQIAPKKKEIVRFWALVGLIFGIFYSFFIERKKDIIYSQITLKKLILFKFIKSLKFSNERFDPNEMDLITKVCFENNKSKYNLININESNELSEVFANDISIKSQNKNIFLVDQILNINSSDKNYLLIEEANITFKSISKFLENNNLKKLEISGWFLIKR